MHAIAIAIFVVLFMGSAVPSLGSGIVSPGWAIGVMVAGPMVVAGLLWVIAGRARRVLDQTGEVQQLGAVDASAGVARVAIVVIHAFAVLVLGALDAVRSVVGDLVAVDELLVVLPPLLGLVLCFVATGGIDRRLREAVLIRRLDAGEPVGDLPGVWSAAWMQTRHQLLIVVIPIALILVWSESVGRLLMLPGIAGWWERASASLGNAGPLVEELLSLPGVLLVMVCMPWVIRRLWRTRPMPRELSELITRMASRNRVRPGALLVWDTASTMVNGAMVGLFWPARQMLLTDLLLERLPRIEVLAVAAHEIAHAKYRHLPWMVGGVLGAILTLAGGADLVAIRIAERGEVGMLFASLWSIGAGGGTLALGLVVFILISRRFEWQADAFAAKELTAVIEGPSAERINPSAVSVVAGALGRVAAYNGVSPDRRAFRHGSIALRQRKLVALTDRPVRGLWIDRQVRVVKIGVVLLLVLAAVFTGLSLRA